MNNFQVEGLIGEGAYGVVLKARRRQTGEAVAIKKFKETDDDELIKKTALREIKVLKSLRHRSIVKLQEVFKKKGLIHLVFEYLDNNLLEVLEKQPHGLPNTLIAKYIYQVLEGLAYMHSLNYVHRDIKPENILVSSEGSIKICDMGFAKLLSNEMTDYVATRWYRSPELLVGHSYGPPIDIWALGCIMAELSDTQPLFPGSNEVDQLQLIISSLGLLTPSLNKSMIQNPLLKHFSFPELSKKDIFAKYRTKLTSQGVNLLRKFLQLDPQKRITAQQALSHPYFDQVRLRKERLQKTSQAWSPRSMQKPRATENYTERINSRITNVLYTTRYDFGEKPPRRFGNDENKQTPSNSISNQFFKFSRKNLKVEKTEPQKHDPSLFQVRLNKIYKKRSKEKSHYIPLNRFMTNGEKIF